MMIAYGRVHNVNAGFYFVIALVYLPFVVIPALLGSWIMVFTVRLLGKPIVRRGLVILSVSVVLLLVLLIKPVTDADTVGQHDARAFEEMFRHTEVSLNPFLPSAWLARPSSPGARDSCGRASSFSFCF